MCLSLRDDHGQAARLATNYDGLVISVLAEAQADGAPERRSAGRCALRRMRKADVAIGDCARLAATVSLVLAAAKLRDHADDGDGAFGWPGVRGAATALAARWAAASTRTGQQLGFEVGVLTTAIGRQTAVEAAAGPGTPLLTVTEPTETATGAAFAHTAVLAGKPANQAPLAEAGRLFGRIAHLLDAVEDLAADQRNGLWNPLPATGTDLAEARRRAMTRCSASSSPSARPSSPTPASRTRCSSTSSPGRCTAYSPARPAPPRRRRTRARGARAQGHTGTRGEGHGHAAAAPRRLAVPSRQRLACPACWRSATGAVAAAGSAATAAKAAVRAASAVATAVTAAAAATAVAATAAADRTNRLKSAIAETTGHATASAQGNDAEGEHVRWRAARR